MLFYWPLKDSLLDSIIKIDFFVFINTKKKINLLYNLSIIKNMEVIKWQM